jgi:hypothetical protein
MPPLAGSLPAVLFIAAAGYAGWRAMQNSGLGGGAGSGSDDPIGGWAVMNGYEVCERPSIGTTELLRHEDEVVGLPYAVPVGPEGGVMYQLRINTGTDREPRFVEPVVVQAFLAAGFPHFSVFGDGDGLPRPLIQTGLRTVEFESAEFADRFHVVVDKGAQDDRLRRLFDPEALVWWTDSCAGMRTEYEYGCLCVAGPPAGGWADLDALLEAAQGIAGRVLEAGAATLRG